MIVSKYLNIDGKDYVEVADDELRQIAEHLLVYGNHNSEDKGEF